MAERHFRYRREDFPELPVKLNHLTIYLDFRADFVEATNCLDITARQPLESIELDANGLEIVGVAWIEDVSDAHGEGTPIDHEYHRKRNKLLVRFPHRLAANARFLVRTITRCVPSDHILEGIYKDVTPESAPQQYVSQCQQWGFQRIMPIFDDCTAKCTMTTTIEADAGYTHLISNGNISRKTNPDGVPVLKPGDPGRKVITYENPVPMAPYLFVVCVGTWDTLVDHVTYRSGRTVRLEYLVPRGRTQDARIPMDILKEAILWIERSQEYVYSGDTYRTICMTKSNFGGMENVGNTTIVTDAALIDEHSLDSTLIYSHGVIVHEFEHNQCGSETTMETPFDMWLNEAYTVDVERQFLESVFDPAFSRLNQVDAIRNPLLGPLAIEDGGSAGRIVREGFNNPDELVDGVTYVKAAEVIRMLRLILGTETFRAGKALYFKRYKHSNANTDQFFQCFEEVSGRSLQQFKKGWLLTRGYPTVVARTQFRADKQEYHIHVRQESSSEPALFHLPIHMALVDATGRTIPGTERTLQLTEEQQLFIVEGVSPAAAFASLNRDYSFYGVFQQEGVSEEQLALRACLDDNLFNRVEAMRLLTDIQRLRLLNDPVCQVDEAWLSVFGEILSDEDLSPALKAFLLRIEEQPIDRRYCTWFPELVAAKEALMTAANARYRDKLLDLFTRIDTYRPCARPWAGTEDRFLKNTLLGLIAADDSQESHRIIIDHYRKATTATDRVAALTVLNRSSSQRRKELLEQAYQAWHQHTGGYPNYLRVVGAGAGDHVFDDIELERSRPTFDINRPALSRALFVTMAGNTKMIWTRRGVRWLGDTVIWLSSVNDYVAGRLLNTFQHFRNLKPALKNEVRPQLERIIAEVPSNKSPTVHGQAKAYLGFA